MRKAGCCAQSVPRSGFFPVFPNARDPKRRTVFHCDGIGLLGLLPFDRLPLKEAVHGYDAASFAVRIPERRQTPHRLALGIDGLAATLRIVAPIWNQTPGFK
jgi:hypothetical protein